MKQLSASPRGYSSVDLLLRYNKSLDIADGETAMMYFPTNLQMTQEQDAVMLKKLSADPKAPRGFWADREATREELESIETPEGVSTSVYHAVKNFFDEIAAEYRYRRIYRK